MAHDCDVRVEVAEPLSRGGRLVVADRRRAVEYLALQVAELDHVPVDHVHDNSADVDLHVHVYHGVADLSVEADPTCLGRGVTTVVAGNCGGSAADVEENQLRLLDDELRQDVPGTSGWMTTPEEFREDTFADPAFDPRTYLVALDSERGELIGLVRIWMNPEGPRLGMVAVKREHRRRGIGSTLVAQALRAVHVAGAAEVRTEYDLTNIGSRALFERIGARRLRTVVELVYEPRVREASGVR